jgi:uncharacterized protein YegL
MSDYLDAIPFDETNPEPRCPCLLLLDVSASMSGRPIAELNAGIMAFREELLRDELATLRVEVAIITIGEHIRYVQEFTTVDQFYPPELGIEGDTPIGEAIELGLDELEARKKLYRSRGIAYYRPWIFLVTDGTPTDSWHVAAERVREGERQKKFSFFAVGVQGADMQVLAQIAAPNRPPLALAGLKFREMFVWLSASLTSVSHSQVGGSVSLQPPTGWAVIE